MANYKRPGVYVEEISKFPPSVVQVSTAIPAFIGYTEIERTEPVRISSMVEFRELFGGPANELPDFTVNPEGKVGDLSAPLAKTPVYTLYYMLRMYFENGGGPCYIISAGAYEETPAVNLPDLEEAIKKLEREDEPTLIVFGDGHAKAGFNDLLVDALAHCGKRTNRFLIGDVVDADLEDFHDAIGINDLSYGAFYYPNLETSLGYEFDESKITVDLDGNDIQLNNPDDKDNSLYHNKDHRQAYFKIMEIIGDVKLTLPPSGAIAGIYARVDNDRGVWKAPANVSLSRVMRPDKLITDEEQEDLNSPVNGKSINAIRKFKGKGNLVWGARTLDGNSNEWRYISVRRFFNMVEESCKNAAFQFVFEPNDANTWVKVKTMIENFLTLQWRAGALMGAKPEDAFFVKVGLGETMSADDINNGKMIVEIGMAVVRPAEFIILRFSHKMMEA